ncbi:MULTISPECIES: hypothetical protein [unclassified Streptomyces]|uniref:hypothetical protein n=1 Tax=unclassified Streptomyces TaxID=2593676 RepID=UPI00379520EA
MVDTVEAVNWNESYAYDPAGNQSATEWPSSHPGHATTGPRSYTGTTITRAGQARYEHDAAGRITLTMRKRE